MPTRQSRPSLARCVQQSQSERAVATPGTPDFLFLWAYIIAYVLALLCLFPVAVATAHRLRRGPASVVGVLGAIVYAGVYLIFIR